MQANQMFWLLITFLMLRHSIQAAEGDATPTSDLRLRVECHDVFELTLTSEEVFDNPFTEARVGATFVAPDGTTRKVGGFYFQGKEWKVRFVPNAVGAWRYGAEFIGKGVPVQSSGVFECVPSDRHGFVRLSKANPYRLEYNDGTPFYPIGQQWGWGVPPQLGFDAPDNQMGLTDRETFMKEFTGATNLIRSQLGCGTNAGVALPLIARQGPLNRYDLENAQKLDESCRAIKKANWVQIMIFFQDMSLWGDGDTAFGKTRDTIAYKSLHGPNLPLIEQYLRYVVARWGVYVDIWELYNEDAFSPDAYVAHLAEVVRATDPYAHPITTNYERPTEPWCEIVCPHEYMAITDRETPGHLSKEFARLKSFGKPVLYTEFGNQAPLGNYDPVKFRVAAWTSFMNEAGLVFWNMSGTKVKPPSQRNPNAYLGPDTRQHFRVLAEFTRSLPVTLRPVFGVTDHQEIQVWVLGNSQTTVLYCHNPIDYGKKTEPKDIIVGAGPGEFNLTWIDPGTGTVLKEETVQGQGKLLTLKVLPFQVDIAARLERKKGHAEK